MSWSLIALLAAYIGAGVILAFLAGGICLACDLTIERIKKRH